MSVYFSPTGDQWHGDDRQVVQAEPRTPQERDDRVIAAALKVLQNITSILAQHHRFGDLSVNPGAAGIRAAADNAARLTEELRACAERIEEGRP